MQRRRDEPVYSIEKLEWKRREFKRMNFGTWEGKIGGGFEVNEVQYLFIGSTQGLMLRGVRVPAVIECADREKEADEL